MIYKAKTTFGAFRFRADLTQASAPIEQETEDGWESTPFSTADAHHDEYQAAELLLRWWGPEYWLNFDADETEDENGEPLYAGMTEEEYISSVILSVA